VCRPVEPPEWLATGIKLSKAALLVLEWLRSHPEP
jgi:hypothetical protein